MTRRCTIGLRKKQNKKAGRLPPLETTGLSSVPSVSKRKILVLRKGSNSYENGNEWYVVKSINMLPPLGGLTKRAVQRWLAIEDVDVEFVL
jgi:hypothetical protein